MQSFRLKDKRKIHHMYARHLAMSDTVNTGPGFGRKGSVSVPKVGLKDSLKSSLLNLSRCVLPPLKNLVSIRGRPPDI